MIRVHYAIDTGEYQLAITSGGTENVVSLDEDAAEKLVRDLLRTGVELTTDRELALKQQLDAKDYHLQDMRRLVFLENEKGDV